MRIPLLLTTSVLVFSSQANQEPRGADWFLQSLTGPCGKIVSSIRMSAALAGLQAFASQGIGMPREAAAKTWLRLYDQWEKAKEGPASNRYYPGSVGVGLVDVASALPRPESWAMIRAGLAQRMQTRDSRILTTYFDRLLGRDQSGVQVELKASVRSDFVFNRPATRTLASSVATRATDVIELGDTPADPEHISQLIPKYGDPTSSNASSGYLAGLPSNVKKDAGATYLAVNTSAYFDPQSVWGPAGSTFDELSRLLDRNTNYKLWDEYVKAAIRAGKTLEATDRIVKVLSDRTLEPGFRTSLLMLKGDLAAAEGDIQTAISDRITARLCAGNKYFDGMTEKLVAIADATGDAKAVAAVVDWAGSAQAQSDALSTGGYVLLKQGRLAEAQRLVMRSAMSANLDVRNRPPWEVPLELAEIYYQADRPQDVLDLLDSFPEWPAEDLSMRVALNVYRPYGAVYEGHPLGFYAAWAFARTGRRALAMRTLRELLVCDLENDDAFNLLNELKDPSALSLYDSLARIDPCAARLVAWKADLLMRLGQLAEAGKLAKTAIAMDPADDGALPGHRMIAYSILSRILLAQRKTEEAAHFERIVRAIRKAEHADRFREAGLLPQALALYQNAHDIYPDDYSINLRLSEVLCDLGRSAESLVYFRRACALMPPSLGETEAPELDTGGVLEDPMPRQIARDIFQTMVAAEPGNPKVLYSMGRVYALDSQFERAARCFEDAVRLDPHYLGALLQLVQNAWIAGLEPKLVQQAALAAIRLDPLGLHGSGRAKPRVTDYAALWHTYADAYASLPKLRSAALYPLRKGDNPQYNFWSSDSGSSGASLWKGPGSVIASMDTFKRILGPANP